MVVTFHPGQGKVLPLPSIFCVSINSIKKIVYTLCSESSVRIFFQVNF